jgi:Tol biopolymer transport system component
MWVQDLERNGVTSHLTSTGSAPVWTQDGKYVVFKSGGRLRPGIYAVRADGASEPKRLMEGAPGALPNSFSPDGKWLAGRADDGIWIAPVEADRDGLQLGKSEPFLRGSGEFYDPRFSPDGHWIAYMWRETGPREVFVRPFPRPPPDGGGRWQISTGNGGTPVWSRNGHELFFQGQEIMVVDYKANGDTFIPGQARRWSERRWRAPSMGFTLFDLAPDGKRMAAVMREEDAAEQKPITHLSFLENFFDELRRRVPAGGK